MNTDLLRKLIEAHFVGDEGQFKTVLLEIIRDEKRRKQSVFAKELERFLMTPDQPTPKTLTVWKRNSASEIPKDREKGFPLLEVREPSRRLEDLVLSDDTLAELNALTMEHRQSELLRSHGLEPSMRMLFYGPPGCGKTASAEAMAAELYLPFVLIRFDALISSYLGETATNLRKIFDFIAKQPCVALFDEFDAIGKSRSSEDEHGEIKRVINSFLQILDGFQSQSILIAATNHQQLLDSALWRRFDKVIQFNEPDTPEISLLLSRLLKRFRIESKVSLASISQQLKGCSHADVERMTIDAMKTSVIEGEQAISTKTFLDSIARTRKRSKIPVGDAQTRGNRDASKKKK